MNLYYPELNMTLDLKKYKLISVSIEEQLTFANFLNQLNAQINGEIGSFILSEKEKEIKLSKVAEIIFNPFSIDINDKKILSKVYKELDERGKELYPQDIAVVNSEILKLIDKFVQLVPYCLEYNLEVNLSDFFKIYNLRLINSEESLLEHLISYVKIAHQILGIEVFIFVNIKQFMTPKDIESFYQAILYEDVCLINIEGLESQYIQGEYHWIVDKDLCIIKDE